jgi:hypothetical protein
MDCSNVEAKQQYLRSEIIDKGYDPQKFSEFLGSISDKGLDIEMWSMEELTEVVYKFQCENECNENKESNYNDINVNDNDNVKVSATNQETTVQNNNNNNNNTSKSKSSEVKTGEFIPCKKQERNRLTDMSNIEIIISE